MSVYLLPFIALAVTVAGQYNLLGATPERNTEFAVIAISIAAIGLVSGLYAIRCPTCGTRLLWYAMRKKEATESLSWLITLSNCPVCGSDGFR